MRPNDKSLQISDPCRFCEPFGSGGVNRGFAGTGNKDRPRLFRQIHHPRDLGPG